MLAIKTDLLNLWQDRTNIYHWYPYVASLLGIIIDLFLIPMTYQPNPVLDYIVFLGLVPLLLAVLIVWLVSKIGLSRGWITPSPNYNAGTL